MEAAARIIRAIAAIALTALAVLALPVAGPRIVGGLAEAAMPRQATPFDLASEPILTDSMRPAYSAGDLVIIDRLDGSERDSVAVGDIVLFQPYSGRDLLITHRVISNDGGQITTQGDANGAPDDPIVPEQIHGRVIASIPLLGHFAKWLFPWGIAIAAVCAAALWILPKPERQGAGDSAGGPAGSDGSEGTGSEV